MYKDSYCAQLGPALTKAVKYIIIINVAVFILINFFKAGRFYAALALTPADLTANFYIWQLISYTFVHLNIWHLLINMLMLYFFGSGLESHWGTKRFVFYYLITGVGAGICSVLTSFHSLIPVVGASGAIFGLLVAYAVLFPEMIILVFFLFPMKIKYAVLLFGAVDLFSALSNPGSGIAYFAHIGGGVTGYLYLKREGLLRKISGVFLRAKERRMEKERREKMKFGKTVDEILDKISKSGMGSLNSKEREILKKKSEG